MRTFPTIHSAFLLSWAAACVLTMADPASASTIASCQDQIQLIREDLAGVTIDDRHAGATNSRLDDKLESATTKLDAKKGAKCGDAIQALWDFIDKLDALANDGKMERSNAERLMCATSSELSSCSSSAPSGAIQCIVELGPTVCADPVTR